MRKRIRYHARQQAVGYLALFIALSGTSYAAARLAPNSVGGKQLKSNAVTSPKVKNRSLLARDFKAGQLPRGAQGIQGAQGLGGLTGPPGAQGSAGPKGDPGNTGLAGPKGDPGNTGPAGPAGPKGGPGNTGPAGPAGPTGPAGSARAWGAVDPRATPTVFSASANVVGVTRPFTGVYCLTITGLTASNPLVANVDYQFTTAPEAQTTVLSRTNDESGCPAGNLQVRTYRSGVTGGALAPPVLADTVGFTFAAY